MKAKFKKSRRGNFFTKKNYETGKTETICRYDIELGHISHKYDGLKKRFTVEGKATYNPMDDFDETLGMRIAESRAKKAVYRQVIDTLKTELKTLKAKEKELTENIKKHNNLLKKEREHFQEILNS